MINALTRDVRTAIRGLAQSPWFTAGVVATLALAIGANTLIFSVIDGVLLTPLPFRHADRAVAVTAGYVSPLDFLDLRQQLHGLDAEAVYYVRTVTLMGRDQPARIAAAQVSANWFALLGVPVQVGRAFTLDEDEPTAPHTMILSDGFWRSRFGGDPSALGRTVTLDGEPYTIIGIAPPGFTYPQRPDVWLPQVIAPWMLASNMRGAHMLNMVGRLAPGTTLSNARQEIGAVTERLRLRYMSAPVNLHYSLVPLQQDLVSDARPALLILFGAVGCVLAIACANVANMLLVRATGRGNEISIRVALGAGRGRIVQQLLTESLLLALFGAVVGVALAYGGVHMLVATRPADLPRLDEVAVNGRVLAFTALLATLTGVLFGLAPALHSARRAAQPAARGASSHCRAGRTRAMLVVAETALAVVLLVGAGLLTRSFVSMMAVDPGLKPEHVVRFAVSLPNTDYPTWAKLRGFTHGVIDQLRALPGTSGAAAGFGMPFGARVGSTPVHIAGRPATPGAEALVWVRLVTPSFFTTLGIPLRTGRVFTDADRAGGHQVVVVSEAFARTNFPNEDPIGKHVALGWVGDSTGHGDSVAAGGEIVGVVGDTKANDLKAAAQEVIYIAFDQQSFGDLTFVVRTSGDPTTVLNAARRVVASLDPNVPLYESGTFAAAIGATVARPRIYAWVVGAFAMTAELLAVIGIYGVLAYAVRERRRELGIRLALGARAGQVTGLVLTQGMRLAGLGVVIGVCAALALSRVLGSLLYGVRSDDALTYGVAGTALLAVAAFASWFPARRAAAIAPVIAMRSE